MIGLGRSSITIGLCTRAAARIASQFPEVTLLTLRSGGMLLARVGGPQTCYVPNAHVVRIVAEKPCEDVRHDRPVANRLRYDVISISAPAWVLANLRRAGVID